MEDTYYFTKPLLNSYGWYFTLDKHFKQSLRFYGIISDDNEVYDIQYSPLDGGEIKTIYNYEHPLSEETQVLRG